MGYYVTDKFPVLLKVPSNSQDIFEIQMDNDGGPIRSLKPKFILKPEVVEWLDDNNIIYWINDDLEYGVALIFGGYEIRFKTEEAALAFKMAWL